MLGMKSKVLSKYWKFEEINLMYHRIISNIISITFIFKFAVYKHSNVRLPLKPPEANVKGSIQIAHSLSQNT